MKMNKALREELIRDLINALSWLTQAERAADALCDLPLGTAWNIGHGGKAQEAYDGIAEAQHLVTTVRRALEKATTGRQSIIAGDGSVIKGVVQVQSIDLKRNVAAQPRPSGYAKQAPMGWKVVGFGGDPSDRRSPRAG